MADIKYTEKFCICCGENFDDIGDAIRISPALYCSLECMWKFSATGVHRYEIDKYLQFSAKEVFQNRMESLPVPVKLRITCKEAEEGTMKMAVQCSGSIHDSFELLLRVQGNLQCDDLVESLAELPRREGVNDQRISRSEGLALELTEQIAYNRYHKRPGIMAVKRDITRSMNIKLHARKTEDPSVTTAEMMLSWKKLAKHNITYDRDQVENFGGGEQQLLAVKFEDWMRTYAKLTGNFKLEFKEDAENSVGRLKIVGNLTSAVKGTDKSMIQEYKQDDEEVTGELIIRQNSNDASSSTSTSRCAAILEFSGTLSFKSKESTYKMQIMHGWIQGWLIQKKDEENAETTDDLESKETQITMIFSVSRQLPERPRQLCGLCKVHEKAHATWPCLHFFCQDCCKTLASKTEEQRVCPFCREIFIKIVDLEHLFD